jgi:hypothetical protein
MPTFSDLLHRRDFGHITVLKLDRCWGLNLEALFSGIPAVEQLSLFECRLQISTILTILTQIAIGAIPSSLQSLSISGNLTTTPFASGMALPGRIAHFHAAAIEWTGDTFSEFWGVVLRAIPCGPLDISVADGRQPQDQWIRLWTLFEGASSDHITSLGWAGCPVSPAFFGMVGRFKKLATLDISGCLSKSDPLLPTLTSLIRTSQTLSELTLCGSSRNRLGLADIEALAVAIGASPSITTVVLSDHFIGPDILVALSAPVAANERIRTLSVDGNDLYSFEVWRRVLLQWQGRGAPLDIAWPVDEMDLLLSHSPEVAVKVQELRGLWRAVVAGTGEKVEACEVVEIDRSGSMDLSCFKETPSIGNAFGFVVPEVTADQVVIPPWIAAPG